MIVKEYELEHLSVYVLEIDDKQYVTIWYFKTENDRNSFVEWYEDRENKSFPIFKESEFDEFIYYHAILFETKEEAFREANLYIKKGEMN